MSNPNGHDSLDVVEPSEGREPPRLSGANANLLGYWLILKPAWKRIAAATVVGVAATFVVCKVVLTQWYQASAIIRASSQQGPVSPMASMLGPNLSSMLSTLTNSTGLGEAIPSDVAEFEDVLQSYHFTTDLIDRHNLGPVLDQRSWIGSIVYWGRQRVNDIQAAVMKFFGYPVAPYDPHWTWYESMQDRFDVEFDDKQGSLTLTFIDRDQGMAGKILGYYISDLRERIRGRVIADTGAVVNSLQEEMLKTPDPLVQQQIAAILGQEIQQLKMAEAEADFAFTVSEAPFVPDDVFKPNTPLLCAAAAAAIPLLAFLSLTLYHKVVVPIREAESASELHQRNGYDRHVPELENSLSLGSRRRPPQGDEQR